MTVHAKVLTYEHCTATCVVQSIITVTVLIRFGKNAIKPYIPRIWAYFLDFLALERNSGKFWTKPLSLVLQKGKTTVEVATAHADSVHVFIKCDQWSNDDIELFWGNFNTRIRFPNTKFISFEPRIALNFHKTHFELTFDNGNEDPLLSTPCTFDNHARVDFACRRQVTGDAFAPKK